MSYIHMTYVGSCAFFVGPISIVLPCSSMNASLDQKVSFYDHVFGLTDRSLGASSSTGAPLGSAISALGGTANNTGTTKGDIYGAPIAAGSAGQTSGQGNIQKRIYRPSPAIAKASISGPVPSSGFQTLIDCAVNGAQVAVAMTYWKKNSFNVSISKARVSMLSIDMKAGDIAHYSMEVVGAEYTPAIVSSFTSHELPCMKLVTWDACALATTLGNLSGYASFSLSINNPTIPIYTTAWSNTGDASGGMMPQKIRLGTQEVTGSIGSYDPVGVYINSPGSISFNMAGQGQSLAALFSSPKDEGGGGPYIRSVSFVGASDGNIWLG